MKSPYRVSSRTLERRDPDNICHFSLCFLGVLFCPNRPAKLQRAVLVFRDAEGAHGALQVLIKYCCRC